MACKPSTTMSKAPSQAHDAQAHERRYARRGHSTPDALARQLNYFSATAAESARPLALARLKRQFAELLLVALDQLSERQGEPFGGAVAHDRAVGDFQEQGLLIGVARVGVGHVESQIDDDFVVGCVDAIGIEIKRLEFAFIEQNLHLGLL